MNEEENSQLTSVGALKTWSQEGVGVRLGSLTLSGLPVGSRLLLAMVIGTCYQSPLGAMHMGVHAGGGGASGSTPSNGHGNRA